MEDLTLLPTTMRVLPYKQSIQKLIGLQRENTELWKERIYNQLNRNNFVRKPKRPTIALDSSNGDWALFIDI